MVCALMHHNLFVLRYIIGGLFGQRNGCVVLGDLKELCICLNIVVEVMVVC